MSLNGLGDAAVLEAREAAAAEPGGWFLLKYESRDEVGLLGHGTGGIVEMREAIAQYDEASPLYGLLKYRRRNVVIKYMPENCSRLIQARVTVHFVAFCEWCAPYNTTFSIAEAKELKDTTLSAACSLHTASSSTSSSTSSLRRRRLMEIAEEEEEEQQRATKRQSLTKDDELAGTSDATSPVTLNAQLASLPDESQFAGNAEPPSFTGSDRPTSPSQSIDSPRLSSQSSRLETHGYSGYGYAKPKVKLAPRPSTDANGRPRTSENSGTFRPVSSIPAGFKIFSRGSKKGKGDSKSGHSHTIEEGPKSPGLTADEIASIPLPAEPSDSLSVARPHTSGGRPTSSSGISVKSIATTIATSTKHEKMTPEKARLMKAMKLREKKKKAGAETALASPTQDVSKPSSDTLSPDTATAAEDHSDAASVTGASITGSLDDRPRSSGGLSTNNTAASNAASGDSAADQASTDTDSHPPSPLVESSEIGDSTKASSLSDSTDETVQALQELKAEADADQSGAVPKDTKVEAAAPEDSNPPATTDDTVQASKSETEKTETTPADEAVSDETSTPSAPVPNNDNNAEAPKDGPAEEPKQEAKSADSEAAEKEQEQETVKASSDPTTIPAITIQQRDSLPAVGFESADVSSTEGKRARRRAKVDPISTDIPVDLSDDDHLMEELQSATVEEATPMLVSKSPASPAFPGTSPLKSPSTQAGSDSDSRRLDRTVSNPTKGSFLSPLTPGDVTTSSARSVSSGAAYLHKMAQQNAANLTAKKTNMGSSISQRIKALEKLSSSAPGPVVDAPARVERPTSSFFAVRKPSVRDTSRSPSIADRASSLTRETAESRPDSRDSMLDMPRVTMSRDRAGSMASRLSMFEGGNPPRGRPESVQVKARIIRNPGQASSKLDDSSPDPSDPSPQGFRQSQLTVSHQKGTGMPGSVYAASASVQAATDSGSVSRKESKKERRMSREARRSQSQDRSETDEQDGSQRRRRSSLSVVKDFIKDRRGSMMSSRNISTDNLSNSGLMSPANIANSPKSTSRPPSVHTIGGGGGGISQRLSMSSRRSMSKDRDMTSPIDGPQSPSEGSGDDAQSVMSDGQKGGRASRFMRRLSSSLGNSRKNASANISPTVAEEEEVFSTVPPSRGSMAAAVQNAVSYIGDVNVQFPDNLLWKRRTMFLDSQGFLILSTGGAAAAGTIVSERSAATVKRYHLSDFRQPYIPEMELQELPNSVCLDFVEGSGLQVACEDRAGQMNILEILRKAHQSHSSFGQ